jgi:hypothetical protein
VPAIVTDVPPDVIPEAGLTELTVGGSCSSVVNVLSPP